MKSSFALKNRNVHMVERKLLPTTLPNLETGMILYILACAKVVLPTEQTEQTEICEEMTVQI